MSWNRRYAARSYVRASIWIVPLIALAVEVGTISVLLGIGSTMAVLFLIDYAARAANPEKLMLAAPCVLGPAATER